MRSLLLVLVASAACAQTPIERIRANVVKFEAEAPDFICHERVTSLRIRDNGGEVEKETIIESSVSARKKGKTLTEQRRIETVDGLAWKERGWPKDVLLLGEGYNSLLSLIFGPRSPATYSMENGAVAFHLNDRVRTANGRVVSEEADGHAWYDAATFEITKMEETLPGGLSVTVEYQPVRIGDTTFRMPGRISAVEHKPGSRGEYQAEYTDYRQY